ncbi:MAG: fibronectin type III domain-containing protein [Pseudomonadota bacterium]
MTVKHVSRPTWFAKISILALAWAAALTACADELTPDMLMNWAEREYPELFAPTARPTKFATPFTYRFYPATGNYIGVSDGGVYVLGPISNSRLSFVGTLDDFACVAGNIGCAVPSAPTITSVTAHDRSAIIRFDAPTSRGSSPIMRYDASCASGFNSIGVATGTQSPITVTGLINGRTYSCIVTAVNQQGISAPSYVVQVVPAVPLSFRPTRIKLTSDFNDYIGGGRTYEYTKANAQISIGGSGNQLSVDVNGDESWFAEFVLPAGQSTWQPGTYTGLTRWPFHDSEKGGLSWSGEGRGCNTLTGSITVTSATYNDGSLDSIEMSFVQNCEGGSSALRGTISWGANDPTQLPGPVIPVPGNLWQAPTSAVPALGNYVYLQSDLGDYIGGGQSYLYTSLQGTWSATGLSVAVDDWNATFVPMLGKALEVGYYSGLERYPFHNPINGGLNWSGNGRGCNTLAGWFTIDELTVTQGQLQHIVMRFEQHCEGANAALRGQIRWSRP